MRQHRWGSKDVLRNSVATEINNFLLFEGQAKCRAAVKLHDQIIVDVTVYVDHT